MQAAEQKTEQPILSKELKEDKKLELSNDIGRSDRDFKEIIANSIQLIDIENLQDKLSALNKALKEPISYPNNYVLASLANRIYKGEKRNSTGQYSHGEAVPGLGNWQLLTVAERSGGLFKTILNAPVNAITQGATSGYFGAAYWNPDTQQVIIVHSGTKNFGGATADLNGVLLNQHVYQIDSAVTFTDKIISVLKEINEKKGSNIQLFITGHSLGAWLAPITAFSAKYLVKEGDYFVASTDFEKTAYHASAVIFDPPGCEEMLRRIQSRLMDRYSPSRINSLDITTYLSAPNLINACNPQVGEVYKLFVDLSGREKQDLWSNVKDWFDININYTRFTHSIEKIKGMFDPETGEVLKDESGQLRIKKVRDWPLLISGDEEATTRNKAFWVAKWAVRVVTHSVPIAGLLTDIGEGTYAAGSFIKWHVEFKGELNNFFKLANKSNDFHLNDEDTHLKTGGRKIRYRTEHLNEDYKNERSLNAFTQPERKFLEEYKFLERYQEDLQGIVTLEELFDSLKDDKKLMGDIMEMLKGCKVENGIVRTQNLQEFIPYIKRMLHLFPEMKQKVAGAYYKLPSNIHNKLYQLISSSYLNAIKNSLDFGRDNFGFKAFVEDSNLKVLYTVQSCTSLGATRVYKTFNLVRNNYRDEKHHAFLNLDRIFYLGEEIFISFLKKIDYKYLLVVEYDDVLNDKIKEFLEKLFSALEDNRNIKVILATEKGSDLSKFISEYVVNNPSKCREENSEVKWNDLTTDSQRKLLEKTIIFQGKEVPLSRVVNGSDALDTIIDPETIVELFKNKKIEIGKALPSLGETEGYYIDRELVKKVKVKEEVLKDDNLTDLFAISNINKEELSRLAGGRKVRNFSEEDPDRSNPIRFITLNGNAGENFNNLCSEYSNCTVHWLKRAENGDLIWRKSHGRTLRRYIENYESDLPENEYSESNTSIKIVDVNDINKFDERLIVVAAEPGMGKTTALTRFGTQKTDDSKWLIRMNLVEYKDKLEQEGFSDAVKFLHENNIVSNTLAKKLLESRLNNSGNIVFLLDGFDEITSKGQTNVVNLIKKLQETKVEKVLISTRLHLRNELENSLSTVAYTLKPFSLEDQAEFLKKFWQRDSGIDQGRLDNYINGLLEFISNSIGDKERRFMGIPMQMRMVAEAFQKGLENQLNQQEPTFPENFDMIKLYDRFLYAKYRVYFGKRRAENIDLDDEDEDWITAKPTKVHRSLALKVLFPEMEKDFIGNNLPSEKDKQKVNQAGIAQCINDRVVFTHRTFAEYFVAGFLADKLSRGKNSKKYETIIEFLARELFESKNEVIKAFLDYRLAKHAAILKKGKLDIIRKNVSVTDALGRSVVHYAAQEGHKEIVDALINNGADIRKPDELGKTALHYAARYNHGTEIVSCLLENAKDCINSKDKKGRTAVYYAAQQGNWEIVDFLIEKKGANIDDLDTEKLLFHYTYKGSVEGIRKVVEKEKKEGEKEIDVTAIKDSHDNTLLHIAAQKGHLMVVEFLLEKGADVGVANNSGKVPISYAADYAAKEEHWDVVESLLRKKAKFNDLSVEQKDLLLNHSAQNAHWDIVKLFMEDNGRDNYFGHLGDQQKVGLLCYTAENERWDIIEFLLKKGTNFNELNNKQQFFLLDHFARNFNWEVVKLFMKDSNKDSYFDKLDDQQKMHCLYYLISVGDLDITRFFIEKLIEKGKISNINTPDNCGKTFLHLAAQDGKLDIVQYLVDEKGANLDAVTSSGSTPLHLAAKNGHLEIVKYFVDKGADLTVKNTDGKTPKDLATEKGYTNVIEFLEQAQQDRLVDAAKQGDLNMVKKLIDQGAKVNASDSNGNAPLQEAAKNGHLNVVECLIEKGANFKEANKDGSTPLHLAAQFGKLAVVQYLVEDKGADFMGADKGGSIPLHLAARNGELEVVQYLMDKIAGFKVDYKLHWAAENGYTEVVKLFIEKGTDLNSKDNNGQTPLNLAIEKGRLDIVQCLVEGKADLNSKDNSGETPLNWAVIEGRLDIVQCLVEGKADLNLKDNSGETPLNFAITKDRLDIVQYLVEGKADLNSQDNSGEAPLHWAVYRGNSNVVKYLKEQGADLNSKDNSGETPLHLVVRRGDLSMAKCLKEQGADLNSKNNYGRTPLHLAAFEDNLSVVKYLKEQGADLNSKNNYGRTPLHSAAFEGNLSVVKYLKEQGADLNSQDNKGRTPLHLVVCGGNLSVVEYLAEQGADLNLQDNEGRTPLHYAEGLRNWLVINFFKKKYAHSQGQESECLIQSYQKQEEAYSHLLEFISNNLQGISIESVKQGLYLPSFEERRVKINGKCVAITRSLSQALSLQSDKSFLNNLETSAKIYERIAQGKQISKQEEREVFAFSKLLDSFERKLDSAANSLPSGLIHTKDYKTPGDLSNYIAEIKGDFAIHLVTSNHVIAIYRTGNNYAYFDSNTAFISGLKSVNQLMQVVEIGVKSAGYKVEEKGFLVEHFDVAEANNQLPDEDKQILTREIKTERQLLAEQDKELGLIKINGQELSRAQLYDFGTKINVEGGVPLLINPNMNLSSKKFQDHLDKKEVSMTAREYLDSLKNSKNAEEATKFIPFIGSKREVEKAEQTREPKFSLRWSIKHLATVFRNSGTTDSATISSTVSLTNTSRSESQSPGTTDETNDRPESYLSGVTVNNQLKRSR